MTTISPDLQRHWDAISPLLSIRSEQDYDLAVERLNIFSTRLGRMSHPLYTQLDTLGAIIRDHEQEHHLLPACGGADVLRFLMDEHRLTQSDHHSV